MPQIILSPQQRFRLLVLGGGALALILFGFLFSSSSSSLPKPSLSSPAGSSPAAVAATVAQFHLLLPATAANVDLCRLLLSTAITGYPEPIFLGWNGHGMYDGAQSHLFKISETAAYLDRLPASADNDLVLLLDGYDIFMQLHVDVMIKRYLVAVERADARLAEEGVLGKQYGGSEVRQSIFFGPDKICWPTDNKRAACWAVPQSSLAKQAFGPNTDRDMVPNRPRWLNSGTIMGPVKDMREMFRGAMTLLNRTYSEEYEFHNSDQFYFQELWAEQEVARTQLRDGKVEPPLVDGVPAHVPNLEDGHRTEFHIALDHESELFQTSAGYGEFLTWMRHNHSSSTPVPAAANNAAINHAALADNPPQTANHSQQQYLRLDQYSLPSEILASPPPIPNTILQAKNLSAALGWQDMMLGVNTVTQKPFPLFHMTGDKSLRARWWPRMWYHPHSEALLKDARAHAHAGDFVAEVAGTRYTSVKMVDSMLGEGATVRGEERRADKGGGWSDQGEWMPWAEMCGQFEHDLFVKG